MNFDIFGMLTDTESWSDF